MKIYFGMKLYVSIFTLFFSAPLMDVPIFAECVRATIIQDWQKDQLMVRTLVQLYIKVIIHIILLNLCLLHKKLKYVDIYGSVFGKRDLLAIFPVMKYDAKCGTCLHKFDCRETTYCLLKIKVVHYHKERDISV